LSILRNVRAPFQRHDIPHLCDERIGADFSDAATIVASS
jgi:hypothetical protein